MDRHIIELIQDLGKSIHKNHKTTSLILLRSIFEDLKRLDFIEHKHCLAYNCCIFGITIKKMDNDGNYKKEKSINE